MLSVVNLQLVGRQIVKAPQHILQRCNSGSVASQQPAFGALKDDPLIKCVQLKIEAKRNQIIEFRKQYGQQRIGDITVNHLYGGMRNMLGLITETSLLDAETGIRFRNLSIEECQETLPKAEGCTEPLPEGMFWLLLTGDTPTKEQSRFLSREWARRAQLPPHVEAHLKSMPSTVHPMTQLSTAVCLCNTESKFAQAQKSAKYDKKEAWKFVYEDSMDLIAKLATISAKIYMKTYKNKTIQYTPAEDICWTRNFCTAIEMTNPQFISLMRLYFTMHSDHEGGNVSAHATHLVGSALADPYLSFSAGLNGLAGPLHGLANQEVLVFIDELRATCGENPSEEDVKSFVIATLEAGKVIPGFGHAVLRKTDPRYIAQREFALRHLPDDPLFKIVGTLYVIVPSILKSLGKVQNPWPNVDAHSGVLLQHYGLTESSFYTVLFGMSRALGCMASLIWDRALMLPLERPKSITTDALIARVQQLRYQTQQG